jgi:PAS domain S-box-containing protein
VPFSPTFKQHQLLNRFRQLRSKPPAAHCAAIAVVGIATALRWLIDPQVVVGLPFITYYPAIIIATLVGGFWPGILSLVLSAVAAWYFFLSPIYSWQLESHGAFSLLFFIIMSSVNISIILFLDMTLQRVIDQERNVRVLIASAPNGILVVDRQGHITLANESMEKLFGYDRSELEGKKVEDLVAESARKNHQALRETYYAKPEARPMGAGRDLSGRRKDGSEFPVEIGLNPVINNGKTAILATVLDITERKRAQEGQQLIIKELQHRTQNLFAVFQSLANRALDEGKTPAEAKFVLNGRLQALARAYKMLADAAWEGASLANILDRQFAGFSKRLDVSGCDIVVTPGAAQQFALIIHELATNALKYGALSAPDGRVSISGKIEGTDGDGRFCFTWHESGGPTVTPPSRRGFGSVILLDAAKQFGQNVALNYAPDGLNYELQIALSAILAQKAQAESSSIIQLRKS